jgi:hypothetical protein
VEGPGGGGGSLARRGRHAGERGALLVFVFAAACHPFVRSFWAAPLFGVSLFLVPSLFVCPLVCPPACLACLFVGLPVCFIGGRDNGDGSDGNGVGS